MCEARASGAPRPPVVRWSWPPGSLRRPSSGPGSCVLRADSSSAAHRMMEGASDGTPVDDGRILSRCDGVVSRHDRTLFDRRSQPARKVQPHQAVFLGGPQAQRLTVEPPGLMEIVDGQPAAGRGIGRHRRLSFKFGPVDLLSSPVPAPRTAPEHCRHDVPEGLCRVVMFWGFRSLRPPAHQ